MTVALETALADLDKTAPCVRALRDRLIAGALKIERSRLNGGIERRLDGNASICFEGVEGEALLLHLDLAGIAASSGSACTSGSLDPSHVLLALGCRTKSRTARSDCRCARAIPKRRSTTSSGSWRKPSRCCGICPRCGKSSRTKANRKEDKDGIQ